MASAEDMRVLLESIGGMDRVLMEQQARADQATAAVQALQQQQQSATSLKLAQRRAAAAQAAGIGASAVVDTRLLGKPVAFDGRERSWISLKFQFLAYRGWSLEGSAGSGRKEGRGSDAQHPRRPRHASYQCSAVPHADPDVPGGCAEAVGARG